MGDNVVQQPQPQPTTLTPGVSSPARPSVSNSAQADAASAARRANSAALVPQPWRAALGPTAFPPDVTQGAAASVAIASPAGPALVELRAATYHLCSYMTPGFAEASTYLTDAGPGAAAALGALREVQQHAEADRAGFTGLRTAVAALARGGDIGGNALQVLTTLTLLSEDGREWLRRDKAHAVSKPLAVYVATTPAFRDAAMLSTKQTLDGVVASINTPQSAAQPSALPLQPPPPTPQELEARNKLVDQIRKIFPNPTALPVATRPGEKSPRSRATALIEGAPARIRDLVFSWHDETTGQTMVTLIGAQLSGTEQAELMASLDPVERLVREIETKPTEPYYEKIHGFLLAHAGDVSTRNAVRSHAALMMRYIEPMLADKRTIILRLIATGREEPDAVDKIHQAAEAGNSAQAVAAIMELGSMDATKLAALRADQILVDAIQRKCNAEVNHNGIMVKPWDLFCRVCGGNPTETREAGAIDKQNAVAPEAQLAPLDDAGRQRLDTYLYSDTPQKLKAELAASFYTNDATVVGHLRAFAQRAAEQDIVQLLHRAHEAPGPELANRTQKLNVDVRLRINRELSGETKTEALRLLGFSVDQAAVGVIGGEGALATDGQKSDGQGQIPLEQALRETELAGTTMSIAIHQKAEAMRDAIAAWFSSESKVRAVWQQYTGMFTEEVQTRLRTKTGLPRVWPIELLANAYIAVGGKPLQSAVTEAVGGQSAVIGEMGLAPSDVAARRTMAAQHAAQTADNEAAAKQQVELQTFADRFREPAKEMFTALSQAKPYLEKSGIDAIGAKVLATKALDRVQAPTAAPRMTIAADAPAVTHEGAAPTPAVATNFKEHYHKEYGIEPDRHTLEVAKALTTRGSLDKAMVATAFGLDEAALAGPTAPVATETIAINALQVAAGFTEQTATTIANEVWKLLHENGQVQLLRHQIDGHTPEEQRVINIAFRKLSSGIDFNFYLQQYAAQFMEGGQVRNVEVITVGGEGADGKGGPLDIHGTKAEAELAGQVARDGRVDLKQGIRASIAGNNMNAVYGAIEKASAEERRAILADEAMMTQLRAFGDDSYEWQRIHGALTGQADLFDRLESRAHGTHGFLGGFDNTDEAGMKTEIKSYVATRKAAITKEVAASGMAPNDQAAEVKKRLRQECLQLGENPSIRSLLEDELSGTEFSEQQGMLMNAGEESHLSSVLNQGDLTENEEKIITDIRAMSKEERAAARSNPAYLERLRASIGSETTWRDAMMALNSEGGSETEESNYAKVERYSRTWRQDSMELNVEENELIDALQALSPEEFVRLRSDPRLQSQIFAALDGDGPATAKARVVLGYSSATAETDTGLKATVEGQQPEKGKSYPRAQIETLAFMKHQATIRVLEGASRSWGTLLAAGVAVFNMKLRPGAPEAEAAKEAAFTPARNGDTARANPHAATAAQAAPRTEPGGGASHGGGGGDPAGGEAATAVAEAANASDPEAALEKQIRTSIWTKVMDEVVKGTGSWGTRDNHSVAAQQSQIEKAVKHEQDPSGSLLEAASGAFSDDEDMIKATLKNASDEKLINEWTTIKAGAANGGPTMASVYASWKQERTKRLAAEKLTPPPAPKPGEPAPQAPRAAVGSAEWLRRTELQAFVVDTSRNLEDALLKFTGGLFADDNATEAGSTRVRDNSEWLEWRTIIREKIPGIDKTKMVAAIDPTNDAEGAELIRHPLHNTMSSLAYDDERYQVDRGANSNYNMDRVTAGGEGTELDNAMGDYRREVRTSVTSSDEKQYGEIDADEQGRIDGARDRFNTSSAEFRAAKSAVAQVAATVAALVITAVVTILTAGTATGPLAVILIGALTAGASSVASNATSEAIRGTDFAFSDEGLKNIARDTIMGAVTAGTTWYAGKIVAGVAGAASAAEQAAALGMKAGGFLGQLGRQVAESSIQTGMQGLFEAGAAPFDPALWMDGWSEGWRRGSAKARDRASEIPAEMMRAAITAAVTTSAGAAMNKLHGGSAAEPPEAPRNSALGNRMSLGERTQHVAGKMGEALPEGLMGGAVEVALDEKTYRAEGQEFKAIAGSIAQSALDEMKDAGGEIHANDAKGVQRIRSGARELSTHGTTLTPNERRLYAEAVMHGSDEGVLSIAEFNQIRGTVIGEAIAKHDSTASPKLTADQKKSFADWARSASSTEDFKHRVQNEGPSKTPGQNIPVPQKPHFDLPALRLSEMTDSKQLDSDLASAHEKTKGHLEQLKAVAPQLTQLASEAAQVHAQVPGASANSAKMAGLAEHFSQTAMALQVSINVAAMGSFELSVVHGDLRQAIANAAANPNDVDAFTKLNEARTVGVMKQQTVPGAAETAAGTAKQQIAELKQILADMHAVADATVRSNANGTPDGPTTTPDGEPIRPVEIKTDTESKDTTAPKPEPTTETDGTKQPPVVETKQPPANDESTKAPETEAKVPVTDPQPAAPTTATLAGNTETPDPQRVQKGIESATTNGLPPGMIRFGSELHVPRGENTPLAVTVEVSTSAPTHEFTPIVTLRIEGDHATLTVSQGASAEAVERAVAGKLAELAFTVNQRMEGKRTTKPSALVEGSQSTELSPADMNKIAQLKMAMNQIAAAKARNDATAEASLKRDAAALAMGMGLLEPEIPKGQEIHQAPSASKGDASYRESGAEASGTRARLIATTLGTDGGAQLQTLLADAHGDKAMLSELRGQREAVRQRLQEWAKKMVAERKAANAALAPIVEAAIGPDGKGHVFSSLIVGGGWSAAADFITSGAHNGDGVPSTMAISQGGDPWSGRGDLLMGQNAAELELHGFAVQPSDLAADQHGFAQSGDFANAVGASAAVAGMPTYEAQVSEVMLKPEGPEGADWPPNANYRVTVNGRSFYTSTIKIMSGPGPARTPNAGTHVIDKASGFAIDTRTGQLFQHNPGARPEFVPVRDRKVPPDVEARLRKNMNILSKTFTDHESGWTVDLSNGSEQFLPPPGWEGGAIPPADVVRRLGNRAEGGATTTPKLVDTKGRVTSNRVVDTTSMYSVDPVTHEVFRPDGQTVGVSSLAADLRTRLGFGPDLKFRRDPRFHDLGNGFSINPATGEVINSKTGDEIHVDKLDPSTRATLQEEMRKRRISFGGDLTVDGYDGKLGDKPNILIYGAGASGAWDVEQAALNKGENGGTIDWAGNSKIPKSVNVPPGPAQAHLQHLLDELHDEKTTPARRSEIARDAKLASFIEHFSYSDGLNRRNTDGNIGAHSEKVLSQIARDPRSIVDIQSTIDGKFFVRFDDGTAKIYDHITMSIGQDPTGLGSVGDLIKNTDRLKPLYGPDGQVVGATDGKGMTVGGAAAATAPVLREFDNESQDNAKHQAATLPSDSANVAGGIVNSAKNINTLNEPDFKGTPPPQSMTPYEKQKYDELLAAFPRESANKRFADWQTNNRKLGVDPETSSPDMTPNVGGGPSAKVASQLGTIANQPRDQRTVAAYVVLDEYMNAGQELPNRGELKSEFRRALVEGLSDRDRSAMLRELAGAYGVAYSGDDGNTVERILEMAFGTGGDQSVATEATN